MEDIMQEKISADHLLYVSLKYTKTCDVMINLLLRWSKMIETSINQILKHAKKKKKISSIGEFRKNVTLKVSYRGKEVSINLEQLKIYAEKLEKFISTTKQFLLK